jgi:hypothetical protein
MLKTMAELEAAQVTKKTTLHKKDDTDNEEKLAAEARKVLVQEPEEYHDGLWAMADLEASM